MNDRVGQLVASIDRTGDLVIHNRRAPGLTVEHRIAELGAIAEERVVAE